MRKVALTMNMHTSPEKVIRAFTEPQMLKEWWHVEKALVEKKEGGLYTLAWNVTDKGFGYVSTGIIQSYQKEGELVIENFVYLNPDKTILGPMTLTVKAQEKGDMTEVYLCQGGYQRGEDWDWYYEAVQQAWPVVMKTFKAYIEKK